MKYFEWILLGLIVFILVVIASHWGYMRITYLPIKEAREVREVFDREKLNVINNLGYYQCPVCDTLYFMRGED